MKFAFVLTNLAGGGAEKAILKTAAALFGRGHQIRLFLLEGGGQYAPPDGIEVEVLATKLRRGWFGKRRLAWALRRCLQRWAADVVVSTLPFADEVCALAGASPHWCRIANTLSAEIERLRIHSPEKAERRLRRYRQLYGGRSLIAVSEGVAKDLVGPLGLTSRHVTIPNPFDFAAIREAARQPCPQRPEEPYVLHVGRFSGQKRHDLLLDAWQRLPPGRQLVLLTEESPALSAMIDARGLGHRVRVAGFQANPYPWMAGADLLVLCSDHEGLPNVLIEALICGTPVLSTDCPSGPREILGDAVPQALVPCDDSKTLAARMGEFLANPPDFSGVALARYSTEQAAQAYEQLVGSKD